MLVVMLTAKGSPTGQRPPMQGQTWSRQRMADATSRKGGLLEADRKVEGSNHELAKIVSLEISVEVFLFKLSTLYLYIYFIRKYLSEHYLYRCTRS